MAAVPSRPIRLAAAALAISLGGVLGAEAGAPAALAQTTGPSSAVPPYPIVGVAATPDAKGYWLVASNGVVFNIGDAPFFGSLGGVPLSKSIEGIAGTRDGRGYWLVASDGGIFAFGDARFHGSTGALDLAKPIVGMAATPDSGGYWMVASDGGIFSFGDARFYGSTGALNLAKPIVGMAATGDGRGYWLVASDGGIFSFGDARFHGSTGALNLAKPIVGMAATPDSGGYWMVASDGGAFAFGDARYFGSTVGSPIPTSGVTSVGLGYWMVNTFGSVNSLGAVSPPAPAIFASGTATGRLPLGQNPSTSMAVTPAMETNCFSPSASASGCNSASLAAIDVARSHEGRDALQLPPGYYQMSINSQMLAVANAERTSRGLPTLPENASLDQMAAQDTKAGTDSGPSGYVWGSNFAAGDPTALTADFAWMYDDGPNGTNIDCSSAGSPGCWGHRDNILAPWAGRSGAGSYTNGNTLQLTELFVENY